MSLLHAVWLLLPLGGAACAAPPSGTSAVTVTVAQVVAGTAGADGAAVVLEGDYRGWHPDPNGHATRQGPPVTRSDWALDDGTGGIYVTGASPDLDPTGQGRRRVRVTGILRHTRSGQPYVEATRAEVR